jgi:hypothetical protein
VRTQIELLQGINKSLCILPDRKQFDEITGKQMRGRTKRRNRRKIATRLKDSREEATDARP